MANMYGPLVRKLRKSGSLPQEFVADKLGLSRPTYVLIEKGERDLTISEAKTLAELFGIELETFLLGGIPKSPIVHLESSKSKRDMEQQVEVRISVPQERKDKFKSVLLYILEKIGAKPNVGEAVLCKLLYFIDFDYYEKFEEQLIGAKYIRNHFGPTPPEFLTIVKEMEIEGRLVKVAGKYFQYDQKKYLPRESADLTILSAQELAHIDDVLNRLSDKTATELSEYSHNDVPWKIHRPGEIIDYESVFYRDSEHSVRAYEDAL